MIRLGVDFGGTKIEVAAIDPSGAVVARLRAATPKDYAEAVEVTGRLVEAVDVRSGGVSGRGVGVALPGSLSPRTGRVRNANSTWLNGEAFDRDLEARLERPVRVANDANCFALSEARDGAGAGAKVVFGLIIGTGCGGGIVVDGSLLVGASAVAGEIGHVPLPWGGPQDPDRRCWCGRMNCIETYVSGSAFATDYRERTGADLTGARIIDLARSGDPTARQIYAEYARRLGGVLALVVDLLDPDVIVLGGGMSNVSELYEDLPGAVAALAFADGLATRIAAAVHGDSSGVRGAAWLWPEER